MEQLDRCRLRSSSINSTDQFTSIHKRVKRARTFKEAVSIGEASRSVLQNAEPLHFKHLIPSDHEHNYWLHWSISSGVSTWTACKQKLVRYFRWSIFFRVFPFFLHESQRVHGYCRLLWNLESHDRYLFRLLKNAHHSHAMLSNLTHVFGCIYYSHAYGRRDFCIYLHDVHHGSHPGRLYT